VLVTAIIKESLNFEDEIPLKGVECNIPLVGIGTFSVKCARGQIFMESKYDRECLIRCSDS
jgi:hypothetical protein